MPTTMEVREAALKNLDRLSSVSPNLMRLMTGLTRRDVEYNRVSELIAKDSVLSGQILRVVNSALYTKKRQIDSVPHAVAFLGVGKLRKLALSFCAAALFRAMKTPEGWSQTRFNLYSAASGLLADVVAEELPVTNGEGAFVAGLLADIGKLAIAVNLPDEYAMIRALQSTSGLDAVACEREILGVDHAELSGLILAKWGLAEHLQRAVFYHHTPDQTPESERRPKEIPLSAVLCEAGRFVEYLGIGSEPPPPDAEPYQMTFPGFDFNPARALGRFEGEWKELVGYLG